MAANAQTTSYYVRTVYETVDKSSTQMADIAKSADKAGGSMKRATASLFSFNQAAEALMRVKQGFDVLIKGPLLDFNSQMEQSRITMAGMLRLNLGGTFESHFGRATKMVEEFQQIAKVSVGTTKDFVDMATMITRPVTAAKLTMEDLRDITQGAVVASRAMGIEAAVAALDIEQALMGTLTKRERFVRALIEPLGFTDTESWNKMEASQRAEVLKGVLSQPAIKEMAKAQETSFAGVTSTLQDNLQMALGKVGLPLFQKITAEVQRWNTWIDANGETITKFADKLSEALVDAFSFIKDVGSFFVENADTLMAVAKGLIAFKAGQMVMGAGRSAIGGLRSAGGFLMGTQSMTQLAGTTAQATSTLGAFAGALGRSLPVIGGLVTVGSMLFEQWQGQSQEQRRARQRFMFEANRSVENVAKIEQTRQSLADVRGRERGGLGLSREDRSLAMFAEKRLGLMQEAQRQFDQQLAEMLFEQGVFTKNFKIDNLELQRKLRDDVLNIGKDQVGTFTKAVTSLENRLGPQGIRDLLLPDTPEETGGDDALAKWNETVDRLTDMAKSGTKVTINKVEVASPDPDRFIHGIARAAERFNRNPTQAQAALRGGL